LCFGLDINFRKANVTFLFVQKFSVGSASVVHRRYQDGSLPRPGQTDVVLNLMAHIARTPGMLFGVVFDGDDTLWSTEKLYDDARSLAREVVAESGVDADRWEERERCIDVQNVVKLGYSMERFPASCVQAYEDLCRTTGGVVDADIVARVRGAARSVFERDPPLVSGARETLTFLRAKGARLALLTKGDPELQARRIERSGLREFFDVIQIVPEKSPAVIRDVVAALGVDVGSAWMVGNSMRSDVLPAIDAGLRAVRIPAHVWEYERAYDQDTVDRVITASHLADIPALITA
jgi:putative hydrolase of the HAD superfamily